MGRTSETVSLVLEILSDMAKIVPMPFETPYDHVKRMRRVEYSAYSHSMRQLQKRGAVKIINRNGKKFIKITRKGELQILLQKAELPMRGKWDGKWRLVMFDIPLSSNEKRFIFRKLLKRNGFCKLQASVYVSPYPLNRDAIRFLKETKLIEYIRIIRADEIDDDTMLRKKFELN